MGYGNESNYKLDKHRFSLYKDQTNEHMRDSFPSILESTSYAQQRVYPRMDLLLDKKAKNI